MPDGMANTIILVASILGTIVIIFDLIIIGVLNHAKAGAKPCGIPIWDWLMLYFFIGVFFWSLILPTFCCLKCCGIKCVLQTAIVVLWLLAVLVGFTIVIGYVIYFNEDNTCQDNYDTSVAAVFMCIFLIFGLFQLLGAAIMICALPIACCYLTLVEDQFNTYVVKNAESIGGTLGATDKPPADDANKQNDAEKGDGKAKEGDKAADTAGDKQDDANAGGNAEGGEEENLIKPKHPSSVTKRKIIK